MELHNAYDENFNLIENVTLVRGEKKPDSMYNLVCDIIVRHTDGSYLLMQRDKNKTHGGMWEASAGGSALKGGTPLQCAVRELKEETGITADSITELGKVIHHKQQVIYVNFLAITGCDKSSIILQKGETQDYKWVTAYTLSAMTGKELKCCRGKIFIEEIQ